MNDEFFNFDSPLILDDAIKHCEEVAEAEEQKLKDWKGDYPHLKKIDSCKECASEHRQLADWLRELKTYRAGVEKIKEQVNNYKGCDMWDTANGMEFALELLEVNQNDSD